MLTPTDVQCFLFEQMPMFNVQYACFLKAKFLLSWLERKENLSMTSIGRKGNELYCMDKWIFSFLFLGKSGGLISILIGGSAWLLLILFCKWQRNPSYRHGVPSMRLISLGGKINGSIKKQAPDDGLYHRAVFRTFFFWTHITVQPVQWTACFRWICWSSINCITRLPLPIE